MKPEEEQSYIRGWRNAWLAILGEALKNLGYDSKEVKEINWLTEREQTIQVLRRICEEHGDNDWDEHLHLADVIDKHLGRYLESNPSNTTEEV